jgi:hypothetical protein
MGHDLRHDHGAAPRRAAAARGRGPRHAVGGAAGGPRGARVPLAAEGRGLGPARAPRHLQLRRVLPPARRRGLPAARRRGGGRRWPATAACRCAGPGDQRPAPPPAGARRRVRRRRRRRAGRDPPRGPVRHRRGAGRHRRQRGVRPRRRAHAALPRPAEPAGRDRLAAAGREHHPRAAHPGDRGRAAGPDRAQPRRIRLPQPRLHRGRVRALAPRRPPAAGTRAAAAGPGGAAHRRGHRVGRARGVAVAGPAHRVRDHTGRHRLRRAGRRRSTGFPRRKSTHAGASRGISGGSGARR